ncbi:unnamed protein product [Hydatigera taeniaeformis]|uniref:SH3 domain-binding protein 5-like n=1 Tax=Hydatigena taeniaeformis TaxID=6205 RepID=A0A158RED2_HYDTA|nr:unnamed protein product [Hydatigera taeniaeformis]
MMDSDSDIVPVAITEDVQKARQDYQSLLSEASRVLSAYAKKFKSSIEKSRPFYENQAKKKKLLVDLQLNSEAFSTLRTEHDEAVSILKSYNIDVAKFVEGEESKLEAVNAAVQKVNKTKMELNELKKKHKEVLAQCSIIEEDLRLHRSRMGTAIRRSQPYFDMQDAYNRKMEDAKQVIDRLTVEVKSAKLLYAKTMSSLEAISNRIHESRRLGHWLNSPLTSPRTRGVGAEVSNSSSEGARAVATPTLSDVGRREGISASVSLPSSPRHTPPGQADTDTEADSEVTRRPAFLESYVATLRKSAASPLPLDVVSALHSCSVEPEFRITQSKDLSIRGVKASERRSR